MTKRANILWTGGWDSTFRVVYASLVEKKEVSPHYLISLERLSSLRELQAISDARKALSLLDKDAAERIDELKITPVTEIKDDSSITEAFDRLRSKSFLGTQYDWLARYAKTNHIENLELSVHVDDKAYSFLNGYVEKCADGSWKMKEGVQEDEAIFSHFMFPLLEISKTEMREQAKNYGFLDVLEKSWFCFNPIGNKPCGLCNPCIYTLEEGMGYRLPRDAILRYRTRRLRVLVKTLLTIPRRAYRKILPS